MSCKQKIIIVNNNLEVGGVQKALINLLNEIKDTYEVTLFVFSSSGEYKENIPKQIKVIEANSLLKLLGISQSQSKGEGMRLFTVRGVLAMWTRLFNNHIPIRLLISTQHKIKGFDAAVSYLHSSCDKAFYGGCNEFVLKRIEAKRKISFIHCDYLSFGGNIARNRLVYEEFDKIAAVSHGCAGSFIAALPELKNKVYCVANCNNYREIINKADENPVEYDGSSFNIITVARLSWEKGIERTLGVLTSLKNKGYKLCYHIVGDGDRKDIILELLHKYDIEKDVVLYGNQANPYRYMKNAGLFLLPSYHEAAPIVFDESKCLGLPILATETTSAREMVEDCKAGWICHNSAEGIQIKLEYILNHMSELEKIRENLKNQKFDNRQAVEQFKCILEGETSNGRNG